ncbi:hypothetical protein P3875_05115 [Myroides sp. JBRI-B21084]|uniref:hypothetical protein n=1 Tax=Myroides sp. JBRI-B21084 TaxID=3119977 RepID=UPI0026E13C8E|nr:hypothetical protein [Paenimyroides cloacae]WKW47444.1 hypothetical protein P3875_05115 [Paenimyroides cloacae]
MIQKGCLIGLLFSVVSVYAQTATFKVALPKPKTLTYYGINHLGDTTSIVSNEIAKETPLKTFTFNDPFLGQIALYDERNPLQQLVFYKNTQHVVILDNQLSFKEKINLTERYPEIDAIYASLTSQNTIWVFDNLSKRWCILTNQQPTPLFVGNSLDKYSFITTNGNFAYWQTNQTVYQMDVYGKITNQISLPQKAQLLAINNDLLVYILNNNLFLLNTKNNKTEHLTNVETPAQTVFLNAKSVSVFTSDKLYLYQIN